MLQLFVHKELDIKINFRSVIMGYGFGDYFATYGMYMLIFFSFNFGLSFIGAAIAGKKGYSYGGFLCLGIFVAFWLSLIIAASCKPRAGSRYLEQRNQQQQYVQPNRHAQPDPYQQPAQPSATPPAENTFCTDCGAQVTSGMAFCPNCGAHLTGGQK